jgi:hypothetical protein
MAVFMSSLMRAFKEEGVVVSVMAVLENGKNKTRGQWA